jgi:CubicO group peptidase (beta-lactamase class C family)
LARIARFVTAVLVIAIVTSCAAATPVPAPVRPSAREARCALPAAGTDFAAANPDATGVKTDAVQHAIDVIAPMLTTSMRVYRHGCLIGKTNIDDAEKNEPQQFFSATKTVVSLLAGRAVTLGKLSVDDPIGKYLPEADAAHGAITVRELLTQTSGMRFAWANDLLTSIKDGEREALNLPLVHEPGTYFQYAQTTITLLGIVVERAVGQDLRTFATTNLFEPIGIEPGTWKWERDGVGHTHGYAWLMMTPIAMGKLGTLVLHNGAWGRLEPPCPAFTRGILTKYIARSSSKQVPWLRASV